MRPRQVSGARLRKEVREKAVFKIAPKDYLEFHGDTWVWGATTARRFEARSMR